MLLFHKEVAKTVKVKDERHRAATQIPVPLMVAGAHGLRGQHVQLHVEGA